MMNPQSDLAGAAGNIGPPSGPSIGPGTGANAGAGAGAGAYAGATGPGGAIAMGGTIPA
jgi:hypothetical protein